MTPLKKMLALSTRWWRLLGRNPHAGWRSLGLKPVRRAVGSVITWLFVFYLVLSVSLAVWSQGFPPSATNIVVSIAGTLTFLGVTVLLLLPRRVWQLLSLHFGFCSIMAFFPSALFFWYYAESAGSVDSDFFGTAGQVLPIFVLAVLIDMGMSGSSARIDLVFFIIVIALGEFASLFALAFDFVDGAYQFGVVCGAFVGGFVGLTMSILARAARD